VVINIARPGKDERKAGTNLASALTSPTDAACTIIGPGAVPEAEAENLSLSSGKKFLSRRLRGEKIKKTR